MLFPWKIKFQIVYTVYMSCRYNNIQRLGNYKLTGIPYHHLKYEYLSYTNKPTITTNYHFVINNEIISIQHELVLHIFLLSNNIYSIITWHTPYHFNHFSCDLQDFAGCNQCQLVCIWSVFCHGLNISIECCVIRKKFSVLCLLSVFKDELVFILNGSMIYYNFLERKHIQTNCILHIPVEGHVDSWQL